MALIPMPQEATRTPYAQAAGEGLATLGAQAASIEGIALNLHGFFLGEVPPQPAKPITAEGPGYFFALQREIEVTAATLDRTHKLLLDLAGQCGIAI